MPTSTMCIRELCTRSPWSSRVGEGHRCWAFSCGKRLSPHEIVLIAQQLPLPQRDPADRFLAATAQVMDLTLATADDNLLRLGAIRPRKPRARPAPPLLVLADTKLYIVDNSARSRVRFAK